MKNRLLLLTFLAFLFSSTLTYSQEGIDIPPQITSVLEYLEAKEKPMANGQPYKVRAVSWRIYDVDKDGTDEIFLQTVPRYSQMPTIAIFQIDNKGKVSRKLEGLAPGKLMPLTEEDRFEDLHGTVYALDVPLSKDEPNKYKELASFAADNGRTVVLYRTYAHTDQHQGNNAFIDLTYLETSRTACGGFKFPQPQQIAVGEMSGKKNNVFVAKVGDQLYCYEIRGFNNRGFMDKTVSVMPVPEDFLQLEVDKDQIKYRTKNDKVKALRN